SIVPEMESIRFAKALRLLLQEVAKRPLVAAAATSNGASLRVLQKCGFVVERVRLSPASDRYPECEEAIFVGFRHNGNAGTVCFQLNQHIAGLRPDRTAAR